MASLYEIIKINIKIYGKKNDLLRYCIKAYFQFPWSYKLFSLLQITILIFNKNNVGNTHYETYFYISFYKSQC